MVIVQLNSIKDEERLTPYVDVGSIQFHRIILGKPFPLYASIHRKEVKKVYVQTEIEEKIINQQFCHPIMSVDRLIFNYEHSNREVPGPLKRKMTIDALKSENFILYKKIGDLSANLETDGKLLDSCLKKNKILETRVNIVHEMLRTLYLSVVRDSYSKSEIMSCINIAVDYLEGKRE